MKKRLKWILPYFKPYRTKIFLGLTLAIFTAILDQLIPWSTKIFFDRLQNYTSNSSSFYFLSEPLFAIVLISLISGTMLFFQRKMVIGSSRKIEYQIRKDLLKSILEQPQSFYDKNTVGDLMSRLTNDLDRIRDFIGPVTLHLNRMTLNTLFSLVALILLSPYLSLIGLIPIFVLPLFVNRFLKKTHHLHTRIQKKLGSLNAFVQDSISGIQVIKIFNKEESFSQKFEQHSQELKKESTKVAFITSGLWPIISFLGSLGVLLVIWQGSKMVINNEITLGTFTAIFLYLIRLQPPLSGLGWVLNLMQRSNASIDRILELKENLLPLIQSNTTSQIKNHNLLFKNLSFTYPYSDQPILKNINLSIPSKSSLGIVGSTGSGKTTLLKLICKIYPPPVNSLFLGDVDSNQISYKEWFSKVSLAPQDGFLFSESIRFNINLGLQKDSIYSYQEVGGLANFEQDLHQIKDGYETVLGEKGINLSGGQKQRVGLARALISNANILCLDDTFSALDSYTEAKTITNLKSKFKQKTIIIASHRCSVVSHCSHIIVLDQGEIKEQGTHQELLAKNGRYTKIYQKQQMKREFNDF